MRTPNTFRISYLRTVLPLFLWANFRRRNVHTMHDGCYSYRTIYTYVYVYSNSEHRMQSINERHLCVYSHSWVSIWGNKSLACLRINEEISFIAYFAAQAFSTLRERERERDTLTNNFLWFPLFPLSVFRSGQSYVDVMFEYTLIMAICSASATANYAHEMAYYWAHTVAHTHTHTDGETDRQTGG